MWLKLGEEELVNLDHCTSIKINENFVIELRYANPSQNRVIQFSDEESCYQAFDNIVKNFVRIQKAME